jgi:hypothetical protein
MGSAQFLAARLKFRHPAANETARHMAGRIEPVKSGASD